MEVPLVTDRAALAGLARGVLCCFNGRELLAVPLGFVFRAKLLPVRLVPQVRVRTLDANLGAGITRAAPARVVVFRSAADH